MAKDARFSARVSKVAHHIEMDRGSPRRTLNFIHTPIKVRAVATSPKKSWRNVSSSIRRETGDFELSVAFLRLWIRPLRSADAHFDSATEEACERSPNGCIPQPFLVPQLSGQQLCRAHV